MQNWLTVPTHQAWLTRQATDLLAFGRRTARDGGGAHWLDDDGVPDHSRPHHTWITTRTVHVYGIGALLGVPGAAPLAEAALAGLNGVLWDEVDGGWYTAVDGTEPAPGKSCYDHAFAVLAGATASHAGLDGGRDLFDVAATVFLERFWDDATGRCVDTWDRSYTRLDPYRGLNANMHGVEAMLAAAGLTGDGAWLERADRVARFVVGQAAANRWRIPEHYDEAWQPLLDHNRDRPADPFKPFGATVGHAFEWSRLLIHLANAPIDTDRVLLVDAARQLFDRAVADGWAPDGAPGFVYTVDWDGTPVVRDRLWWVLAEAIAAAAVLRRQTGDERYAAHYRRWWDHAAVHHIDPLDGSWRHQLDHENRPDTTVWSGKPDLYHAFQVALIPTLPLYPMVAAAVDARATRAT
jgi:mannose/cellobiose epimerase-like protein (N-acyl-D-glucosamine 2-epimerase family)